MYTKAPGHLRATGSNWHHVSAPNFKFFDVNRGFGQWAAGSHNIYRMSQKTGSFSAFASQKAVGDSQARCPLFSATVRETQSLRS